MEPVDSTRALEPERLRVPVPKVRALLPVRLPRVAEVPLVPPEPGLALKGPAATVSMLLLYMATFSPRST